MSSGGEFTNSSDTCIDDELSVDGMFGVLKNAFELLKKVRREKEAVAAAKRACRIPAKQYIQGDQEGGATRLFKNISQSSRFGVILFFGIHFVCQDLCSCASWKCWKVMILIFNNDQMPLEGMKFMTIKKCTLALRQLENRISADHYI